MKKLTLVAFALLAMVIAGPVAKADNIYINDWLFNVNGTIYNPTPLPPNFNVGGFDFSTPDSILGTITATFSIPGNYSVIGFFDLDIEGGNNTIANEVGFFHNLGSLALGQSWELGPGESVSPGVFDDAYSAGLLTNSSWASVPDDVAMAIGWNFTVGANPVNLSFTLGFTAPSSGFYLQQVDQLATGALGQPSIYYSSSLSTGGQPVIPEPGTLILLGTGLGVVGLSAFRKRR
jgi:hypothetical protein